MAKLKSQLNEIKSTYNSKNPKKKIGFNISNDNEPFENIKIKLNFLKDLLKECKDATIKTWLRDKINELFIELL